MSDTFRVLMVCTANVCRSPMAEYLLRDALTDLWGSATSWDVMSAGVRAEPGVGMHPYARRALERRGVDVGAFRSRRITRQGVEQADLILTAERAHRAAIVTMVPPAVHRTFTLRQFERMMKHVAPLDGDVEPSLLGRQLTDAAIGARSRLQPTTPQDDNLPDPIGHRASVFRRCADQLSNVVDAIMAPLTGTG